MSLFYIYYTSKQELYALFKDKEVSKHIKLSKLGWTGHVMRKKDQEISKQLLLGNRKRGRPRLRWKDEKDEDAKIFGIRNWQMLT